MMMCTKIPLVLLFVSFTVNLVQSEWHQVWSDEFDGNGLNDSEWTYHTGCSGWGNEELECYTAHRSQNVRVDGGNLVIDAKVEEYSGKHFTSGRIASRQAWTYGKFEARAKMPSGHHLWPAIWMMPQGSKYGGWAASGEIDIMELRGDKPNQISCTIHYGGSWPNTKSMGSGDRTYSFDFSKDFHIFGLEWEKNEMRCLLDGKVYRTYNINQMLWSGKGKNPYTKNGQPFDEPFYWILDVAVGGHMFGKGPYVTPEQAKNWTKPTMEVDYVRVYQQK